jgi:hypothetical protein
LIQPARLFRGNVLVLDADLRPGISFIYEGRHRGAVRPHSSGKWNLNYFFLTLPEREWEEDDEELREELREEPDEERERELEEPEE